MLASLLAWALVSWASVATMPMVVAMPAIRCAGNWPSTSAASVSSGVRPSSARAPATTRPEAGSTTSPMALTATSAPTVMAPTFSDALPMPPFIARPMPNSLPTQAPAPAPTLPWAGWAVLAASHAAKPAAASGRMRASPTHRSNSTAAGTMGTRAGPTCTPWPCSSSQRITPVAASRPKALPPVSRMACTCSSVASGCSRSVSRVPGAAPRTSTPATAPCGHSSTVQPVGRRVSVWWPTDRPAMSVMAPGNIVARATSWRARVAPRWPGRPSAWPRASSRCGSGPPCRAIQRSRGRSSRSA